ncbi:hypothetical protein B296_00012536 [Ensete ventricosum]|uniref:Uncharacterized protein n=1 Tax=Ensete ventricosum TaxID=4639 RepID=A0A427B0B8_ENSVE|nr:hypothetical protein B296_00012536 [Ensete ventricosum]
MARAYLYLRSRSAIQVRTGIPSSFRYGMVPGTKRKTRRRLILPLEDEASPRCLVLAQGDARYFNHNLKKRDSSVSNLEPDHTLAASNLHISLLETPLDIWDPTSGRYTMVEPGCSLKIRPP